MTINARLALSSKQWDIVRRKTYKKAGYKCEICGIKGIVHCHEIWSYDEETITQRLSGLISLCPTCHDCKHFGRSQLIGKTEECIAQMMKVNDWSYAETEKYINKKQIEWNKRNKKEWEVDMEILAEILNLDSRWLF